MKHNLAGTRRIALTLVLFLASALLALSASVKLQWDKNPEPDIGGYILHFGPASRVYTNTLMVGNVTNATVEGLTNVGTYHFAVTATNLAGLESDWSNECIIFPGPGGFALASVVRRESVTVSWQPSSNTNVTKYYIYYGPTPVTNKVDRFKTNVVASVHQVTVPIPPTVTNTLYLGISASVGDELQDGGFTNSSWLSKLDLTWPGKSGNLRRDY